MNHNLNLDHGNGYNTSCFAACYSDHMEEECSHLTTSKIKSPVTTHVYSAVCSQHVHFNTIHKLLHHATNFTT